MTKQKLPARAGSFKNKYVTRGELYEWEFGGNLLKIHLGFLLIGVNHV